jgi:2-keto-4-pentenoate hydratase/2-oxohepta-3-ene-1,7-dioic acid hydratase in catechol pathway
VPAAEAGVPVPTEPLIFTKLPSSIIGPDAPIELPSISEQVDYEAELAVVIGRRTKGVSTAQALDCVAG